ncbi:hypothetical protein BU24DRAFT_453558 [Aaosphaeria arxii CBS 175.79]|uniref:Ent-kaurene synthase n=1 Tax=Aaosphaeria arxii CBS 175.79 TaxID=1450172 RepID=A0A6A5XGQ6_9PLEO|nr:uncharacterized protein BU24DRAFT_453558 [Aaosphaeria arxii CBS 175.79]KAF2012100.1 hypothetical protein BU24DRAFT_453558 [Aaosphaeria arxii CBS 175.79]
MGRDIDFEPMLAEFERSTYFITYYGERNASISANCNVLAALLQSGNVAKYTSQILKCAEFLNNAWRSGNVQDKWNISKNYSMMLLTQAFVQLLRAWKLKQLDSDTDLEALMQSVRATLLDVYVQTVQHQHEDGSWSSMREVTAYAILTLSSLVELPWKDSIRATAAASIAKGKSYLLKHQNLWAEAEYLWIEKVAYSSSNLSNAYCLAAVEASGPRERLVNDDEMAFAKSSAHIAKYTGLFKALKPFQNCPEWKLEASMMQSQPFVANLKSRQTRIFPEMGKMKSHKYMDMIPLTWIGCNHVRDHGVSSKMLWEMMMISMLNYQADVYMEMVVGDKLDGSLAEVRRIIDRAIKSPTRVSGKRKGEQKDGQQNGSVSDETNETNPYGHKRAKMNGSNGTHINGGPVTDACQFESGSSHTNGIKECTSDNGTSNGTMPSKGVLAEVEVTINAFTTYVLTHPSVIRSPSYLQRWLAQSLHAFLDAHITQIEDCKLLSDGELPKETYYNWVHTTSSNHTSCPYSFVFYLCLLHGTRTGIGKTPVDLFPGAKTKYMLEDACRHLATICRQHNDFGSVERDKEEANLNSVDFPEFDGTQESDKDAHRSDSAVEQAKKEVLVIAKYERKFLDLSLAELRKNVKQDVMRELMLLFHVTDIYGEIYLARDMSPSRSSLQ